MKLCLKNQPIGEFKDSFAFDIAFNLKGMADYLLDNGVEIHYMKDMSKCWRIDDRDICTCPENMDCEDSMDCKFCQFLKSELRLVEGIYWSSLDDVVFGKTVFATKEEAEAKLKELIENDAK